MHDEERFEPYTLEPTLLTPAMAASVVTSLPEGLAFTVAEAWCAPGEQRVGYATIVRLAELVREFHWERDVRPVAEGADSITASLSAEFNRPMDAGMSVLGSYGVSWVRKRSYGLLVTFKETETAERLASVALACVFWDPASSSVTNPSPEIIRRLRESHTE